MSTATFNPVLNVKNRAKDFLRGFIPAHRRFLRSGKEFFEQLSLQLQQAKDAADRALESAQTSAALRSEEMKTTTDDSNAVITEKGHAE